MKTKTDIIIAGLRLHNILKISQILAQAAIFEGIDVKTAEFTNEPIMSYETAHIRFGRNVLSPLIPEGTCDILVCFEPFFAKKIAINYLSSKGSIIINNKSLLAPDMSLNKILASLTKLKIKIILIDVAIITNNAGSISEGYLAMLGMIFKQKVLPLSKESIIRSVKEIVPLATISLCLKAFETGIK